MTPAEIEDLKTRVARHPFWYHHIELPGGVVTPGVNPLNMEAYQIPKDLSGKRVLDVGAWDGYWTFEALKRGAREVLAIDDFSDYMGFLSTEHRQAWATFDLCRQALGHDQKVCQREEVSVYDVTESRFGRFDVIFFFGTLYHLRHPLLALDRLGAVCDESIHVESAICDDHSPYRGGLGQGYAGGQMVMEFYPRNELANNATNWWSPTLHCLANMVAASGFARVQAWKLVENPTQLGLCRGFASGWKKA
jgi:tRNA (mo5U34)-methyltransferase